MASVGERGTAFRMNGVLPGDRAGKTRPRDGALDHLRHAIDHASHLLPAQGPITVFIHHNTLHAFEDLPFEEAVERAAGVFGCEPYLAEDQYRRELVRGRILLNDLRADLAAEL